MQEKILVRDLYSWLQLCRVIEKADNAENPFSQHDEEMERFIYGSV